MKNRKSLNENAFMKVIYFMVWMSMALLFFVSAIAFNAMLMLAFINFLTGTPQPMWMTSNLLIVLFIAEGVTFAVVLITTKWLCDKIGV